MYLWPSRAASAPPLSLPHSPGLRLCPTHGDVGFLRPEQTACPNECFLGDRHCNGLYVPPNNQDFLHVRDETGSGKRSHMRKSQNYERLGRSPGCPAPRAHSAALFCFPGRPAAKRASSTATYNPVTSWLPASARFLSSTREHADCPSGSPGSCSSHTLTRTVGQHHAVCPQGPLSRAGKHTIRD